MIEKVPTGLATRIYATATRPGALRILDRASTLAEKGFFAGLLARLGVDCLLDVGANCGQYAMMLRKIGYRNRIISFEPNPEAFAILSRRVCDDAQWSGFNCGLGAVDGEMEMNIYEHSEISSLLPADVLLKAPVTKRQTVQIRRLDQLFSDIPDTKECKRIFLKCDTQGFDVEVVRGSEGLMPRIAGLQSELAVQKLYKGMPGYLEAMTFYESQGFLLVDLWRTNRTVSGEILELDGIFVKY